MLAIAAIAASIAVFAWWLWHYSHSALFEPLAERSTHLLAFDLEVYRQAAQHLLAGESPFSTHQLQGAFPAVENENNYLYAPAFALLLAPLSTLPYVVAAVIWTGGQLVGMIWIGVLLVRNTSGKVTTMTILSVTAAILGFTPSWAIITDGNINGWLACAVGLVLLDVSPGVRGSAIVLSAMTKGVTAALLPAQVARHGWRSLGLATAVVSGAVIASAMMSLDAWNDYPRVLLHLAQGETHSWSLAPAVWITGIFPEWSTSIRLGLWVLILALIIVSVRLARRPGGWSAATLMGLSAGLLVPAGVFVPWTVMLLPFAIKAWAMGTTGARAALGIIGAPIFLYHILPTSMLPLLLVAWIVTMAVTLWPRRSRAWDLSE